MIVLNHFYTLLHTVAPSFPSIFRKRKTNVTVRTLIKNTSSSIFTSSGGGGSRCVTNVYLVDLELMIVMVVVSNLVLLLLMLVLFLFLLLTLLHVYVCMSQSCLLNHCWHLNVSLFTWWTTILDYSLDCSLAISVGCSLGQIFGDLLGCSFG